MGSDGANLRSSDTTKKPENVFITRICVADVITPGLRSTPTGLCAEIEIDGRTTKTSRKPIIEGENAMEWEEEIVLPSERSATISIQVYGSVEPASKLENDGIEILCKFATTVGDVLGQEHEQELINILDQTALPSPASLRISAKRCMYSGDGSPTRPELSEDSTMSQRARLVDSGRFSLLRYHLLHNQSDLEDAVIRFEYVRDRMVPDSSGYATISFDLATVIFLHCQGNHYDGLDMPITLYQEALGFHTAGPSGHWLTALDLCFALLVHLQRQEGNVIEDGHVLLYGVVKSYAYQAAWFALQLAEISVPDGVMQSGIPEEGQESSTLEELISNQRDELDTLPDQHPERISALNNLGCLLYHQFQADHKLSTIQEAILLLEQVVEKTPDGHPRKPSRLNNLGSALMDQFKQLGDIADIDKSILVTEKGLNLTPDGDPEKPAWLNNLGNALSTCIEHLGNKADIDKHIMVYGKAVDLTPAGDSEKPGRLNNLGNSFMTRFEHLGDPEDMKKAIVAYQESVDLTPDGNIKKLGRLNNLGNSLLAHFQRFGDLDDMNRSISIFEKVISLAPDSHPDKPGWLTNLGMSLYRRFERFGDPMDINKAIEMLDQVVDLTSDDNPMKSLLLNMLGNLLSGRFKHLGDLADIDKSSVAYEKAINLLPANHPSRLALLNNFGNALYQRFQHLGNLVDLNKSVLLFDEANNLTPDGSQHKVARLGNLGGSLLHRFQYLHNMEDMNRSILLLEEAVRLAPNNHPSTPGWLTNLGISLCRRFQEQSDLVDINRSISVFENAIELTPDGHPNKPGWLNNLGNALSNRFLCTEDPNDINKSILMKEKALNLTPDGHPFKSSELRNLGDSLLMKYEHTHDSSDLTAAIQSFESATKHPAGRASMRFYAASRWIHCLSLQHDSQNFTASRLDAYATTMNLLPQLAWLGLSLTERHNQLVRASRIACAAAAVALEAGFPEMAVEWLEQGRSVVWSQFLQLRTPVDELHVKHPLLADEFQQISKQLEHAGSHHNDDSTSFTLPANGMTIAAGNDLESMEAKVLKHHDLALRREKLLSEIRSLPGFTQFLLSKKLKELASLANSGPVVYLNSTTKRCDALIVMESETVISVPLHQIEYESLEYLLCLLLERSHPLIPGPRAGKNTSANTVFHPFDDVLDMQVFPDPSMGNEEEDGKRDGFTVEGYSHNDRLRWILANLWTRVVHPVLDALGFLTAPSDARKLRHIFWCPTGPFVFLPIHAAGIYRKDGSGPKLSDFAISSYTPTLGALAPTIGEVGSDPNIHLLVVPQPEDDREVRLPCVKTEIDHIVVSSSKSIFISVQESSGVIEDVMEKMKTADWVHFACHGVQDPKRPLDSGLCLANGRRLKLSDIAQLSRPQGGLAFLSACQTAKGDEKLSEESVHLAAGMLLAGYGSVIATMWSIMDRDAPKVARNVYEYLLRDGKVPESAEAAEALHFAVKRLRDSGVAFTSWVPFIHVGR